VSPTLEITLPDKGDRTVILELSFLNILLFFLQKKHLTVLLNHSLQVTKITKVTDLGINVQELIHHSMSKSSTDDMS
jgi:hypothetical protein